MMVELEEAVRQRAEMLELTLWLSEFSWQEIETLARYFHLMETDKGATIFSEGDQDNYMCLIVRGSVKVVKKDANQQPKELSFIGRGKAFGEMMLFDSEPRSATIIAAEKTTLLVLSLKSFENIMADAPRLATKLLWKLCRMMSQRLRATSGQLVDFI